MAKDNKDNTEGRITEEGLKELRDLDGANLRIGKMRNGNELVCRETIRHFADGIGDTNPLYLDEEYAAKTSFKTLSAPPCWLYSVIGPGVQHGLPGVHSFHAGDDWEFYKPIMLNDKIKGEAVARGYEEIIGSTFAQRMIKQLQDRLYYNQTGELIAKAKRWNLRTERSEIKRKGRYSNTKLPHPWTEEELDKIKDQILSMKIRGSEVRYWEDVTVGEELPALIKGPIGITDEVAWTAGYAPGWLKANEAAFGIYARHPSWGFRDPDTFAMEPIAAVHWSKWAAKIAGLPYPYDLGAQRHSWVIQSLCNWMGDEGWVKRCYAEYRAFVFLSDVVWLKGTVTRKYLDENGEACVDIATTGVNQRNEDTIPGKSTVVLPSREKGTWPVRKRLPA
ncbi:MAG: MaoC family dehydratase N-terminal domain-containing protein [Dehalococcoidales bacterium]|nr:MaoC family dehydratase N-terminal domain-containing protein [Dehalococcoidales bacterium]